jgi:hypothetical protein
MNPDKIHCFDLLFGGLSWDGPNNKLLDLEKLKDSGFPMEWVPKSFLQSNAEVVSFETRQANAIAALHFARALADSLMDANEAFKHQPFSDYIEVINVLTEAPDQGTCVKWLKHMTCWPLAKFARNDEPDIPEGLVQALGYEENLPSDIPEPPGLPSRRKKIMYLPLRGGSRRMLKRLLVNKPSNKVPLKVCWAILQGAKRGCAEVTAEFVEAALDKHHIALTMEREPLEEGIKEEFRKKFRNIFRAKKYTRYCNGRKWSCFNTRHFDRVEGNPGPNSCYEKTRSKDGRAGYVRERWKIHLEEVLGLAEGDLIGSHFDTTSGEITEERYSKNMLPRIPHSFLVREALNTLKQQKGVCHATVVECLEPLKCRLITKGNAMPYAAAMPFQKDMRAHLYESHFAFRLIGEPLTEQLLHELLAKERRAGIFAEDIRKGKVIKWNSGDFSAATDGISQEINSLALEEYINSCADITEDEKTILRAVLGNHLLNYVEPHEVYHPYKEREPFMMKNGQLMGCPISFPILCAINLAAYWLALEEHTGRKFDIEELPVLINGDDILFRATDELAAKWLTWITRAGFSLSKGKNYLAKDFLTVNSVCYSYRSQEQRQAQANLERAKAGVKAKKKYVPKGSTKEGDTIGFTSSADEEPTLAPPGMSEENYADAVAYQQRLKAKYGVTYPIGLWADTDQEEVEDGPTQLWEGGPPWVEVTNKVEESTEKSEPDSKSIEMAIEVGTNLSDSFTKIGYLNTGLLYQNQTMKALGWQHGCRAELRQKPFADKINDLLDNCCDKKRTWKLVKKHYAIEIAEATLSGDLSLTAHTSLGGVGINPTGIEEDTYYTPFQRKLGGFLKDRLKKGLFGNRETEVDGRKRVDLNKNLDIEGRVCYRNDKLTIAKVPADLCYGDVVMRRIDEPLREHEHRIKDLHNTNALYNYQAPFDFKKKDLKWTQGYLPSKVMKEFRATKYPVVLKDPSQFHLEARCTNLYRTDSQFVWDVEVKTEKGVELYKFLPGVHQELDPAGMTKPPSNIHLKEVSPQDEAVDHSNTSLDKYSPFCTFGAGGINSAHQLVQSANGQQPPIVEPSEEAIESDTVEKVSSIVEDC